MTAPRCNPRSLDIVYLDQALLVVNKPAGVFLTRQRGGQIGVPNLLAEHPELNSDEPFLVVHHLPEGASGLVIYARTLEARHALAEQFTTGKAKVYYQAVVTGYVQHDTLIDVPLFYDKRAGRLRASQRRGDPAGTRLKILRRLSGNTLIECHASQERTDQIRVHLAAIDHPLTVDPRYGGGQSILLSDYKSGYRPSGRRPERPLVDRLTLHAERVSLTQPLDGAQLSFEAALPKDLKSAIVQLGRLC